VTPPVRLAAGEPFCSNPSCSLHVCEGDPGVTGEGNFAQIRDLTVGRGRYEGRMLCDVCGVAVVSGVDPPGIP